MNGITDQVKKVIRRSLDFLSGTNKDNTSDEVQKFNECAEGNDIEMDPNVSETVPIDSTQSDVIPIDIDSLMAQKTLPTEEEEESDDVILIDIFSQKYGGDDQTKEEKCHSLRKMLLSGNPFKWSLIPGYNSVDLLTDKEIDSIMNGLRADQLLLIAHLWPQLKTKIGEFIANQTFLWFTTDLMNGRFAPHEDCCDLCDHILDLNESTIRIRNNQCLAQVFKAFNRMSIVFSSLKCLRLFRFIINEESDQWMAEMCPNLVHLDLTESPIKCWKNLSAHHKSLKHLILPSTQINDDMIRAILKNKKYVKTFVVNNTDIIGKDLSFLYYGIERFDNRCCDQLLPNYLEPFLLNAIIFKHLKYLRIEVAFDDNTFAKMCSTFTNLILLELSAHKRENTRLFTTKGLKQISRLSKLRSLKFGTGIAVHPIPLMDIYIGCPLMSSFSIDGSDCFVEIKESEVCPTNPLSKMADYWPLIRKLEFKGVESIKKETIDGFTGLEYLTHLNLTECPSVDDSCLVPNIAHMKRLNYLVVDKCHRLTIYAFDAVVEKAKTMDTVLSASFFRCSFTVDYITKNQLPENLRLTFSSIKAKRCMTFDGNRAKYFRAQDVHKYFNGY